MAIEIAEQWLSNLLLTAGVIGIVGLVACLMFVYEARETKSKKWLSIYIGFVSGSIVFCLPAVGTIVVMVCAVVWDQMSMNIPAIAFVSGCFVAFLALSLFIGVLLRRRFEKE